MTLTEHPHLSSVPLHCCNRAPPSAISYYSGSTDSLLVTTNNCFSNPIRVSVQFYVHSTDDMPTIGRDKPHWEFQGTEQQVYVEHKQIVASPELRQLDPEQRGCLFRDEAKRYRTPAGTQELPIYTYNFCKMACRSRMARRLCNCIPFFYRTIG